MILEKRGNMAKRRFKYTIFVIIFIGLCLQACIKDTGDDVKITTIPTEKSQLEEDEPDIQIQKEENVTQIIIDGNGDDWTSYGVVSSDELGDQIPGSPDLAEVRAFKNDKYLYILVKFNEGGNFDHIIFGLEMEESTTYQFNVFLSGNAEIGRPIDSNLVSIPVFSAQGEVFEIKVALDEIGGQPQRLNSIETCCFGEDYKRGDTMDGGQILAVNETEPDISSTTVQERTDRPGHINLVDVTLEAEYLYRSFLQIPVGMAWGIDGYLYIADWTGRHVIRVSKDGDMDDLGLWKTVGTLQQDGPRGIAFDSMGNLYINNHGSILRRDTARNVDQLSGTTGSPLGSIAISPSDELFYTDRGSGKLMKWTHEDGSIVIASNLPFAENLTFGLDGTLYLTQMGQCDVMKVDIATGEAEIFAPDICTFDPCFLAVDPEGDIWVRGIWHLHQYTPEGVEKPFVIDGQTYLGRSFNWHTSGGIAFDDEGGLWVAFYNSKLIRLAPVTPGISDPEFTMQIISPGLEASDLATDSNGAIYATDLNVGQVLKINANKDVQVLIEHGSAARMAVAVDENDVVYLGMPNGEIIRLEDDGSLTHYATLETQRMVFGGDGNLYASAGKSGEPKSIVKISDKDAISTIATKIDGIPLGNGEVHLSPALDKGLYVFTERERNLFFVDFEGQGHLIANLQALGGGGPTVMAASPISGDIYFVPHGPYTLYRIDPEGNYEVVAYGVFGDPWGMVASRDGQWLYIAESGVIDKIPIPE